MTHPLRIGLAMLHDQGWIGGTQYMANIVLALNSLPADVCSTFELSLLCSKAPNPDRYSQIKPYLKKLYYEEEELQPRTTQNRWRWKLMKTLLGQGDPRMRPFLKKHNIDFLYPDLFPDAPFARQTSTHSAAWIYDFQHKYLPEFFTLKEIQNRDRDFARIARRASTIVLSSKTAEVDFHNFFPEAAHKSTVLQFRTSPASAWYEGKPQQIQHQYALPDRFFLVSNQFWRHKNHLAVFQALKLLQLQGICPTVVCTGQLHDSQNSDYAEKVVQTIEAFNLSQQIYLLGLIPRLDQIQLMRRAIAVIQPSLFEGWSTVVEDARCLGKRLILSDLPVHLEQSPPNSVFFERNSPESLASFIADWWEHLPPGSDLDQETIARAKNISEVQEFGYRFLEIAQGH